MFENTVLRRIYGPKRGEETEEWRKLHNEELSDLLRSPNVVRVIKSRRIRCTGHVAHMGEGRGVYRVLVGKPEGKRHLEHLGEDARIMLRWILRKCDVGGMDWIELDQDKDRWRTLLNLVMNFRVP